MRRDCNWCLQAGQGGVWGLQASLIMSSPSTLAPRLILVSQPYFNEPGWIGAERRWGSGCVGQSEMVESNSLADLGLMLTGQWTSMGSVFPFSASCPFPRMRPLEITPKTRVLQVGGRPQQGKAFLNTQFHVVSPRAVCHTHAPSTSALPRLARSARSLRASVRLRAGDRH